MDYKNIANELKKEYHYKLNTESDILNKIITSCFDNSSWKNFDSKSACPKIGNFKGNVKNNKFSLDGEDGQYGMLKSKSLFNNKYLKSLLESDNVKNILKEYFGREPKLNRKKLNIFYTKNIDGKSKQIKKQGWHIDDPVRLHNNKNYNFIKMFIPLCDVNEDNGVTHIIKGSRDNLPPGLELSKIQGKRFPDEYINKNYPSDLLIKINSNLGDYFLTRNDCFHKGGYCNPGKERLMIIAEYFVE